jgi:hypothetical protein
VANENLSEEDLAAVPGQFRSHLDSLLDHCRLHRPWPLIKSSRASGPANPAPDGTPGRRQEITLWNRLHGATGEPPDPQMGIELLRQFLVARRVSSQLAGLQAGGPQPDTRDLVASVRTEIARKVSLASDYPPDFGSVFPAGGLFPVANQRQNPLPTGVPFLNDWMRGGSLPGEVEVVLSSTGVGKTTLGIQILVASARAAEEQAAAGGKGRLNVYADYAEGADSIEERMVRLAARVPRSAYHSQGGTICVPEWLRRYAYYIDTRSSRAAYGGLHGLVDFLHWLQQESGLAFGNVVIDDAEGAVESYLQSAGGRDPATQRQHLSTYVERVRDQIAVPFGCTVWVLHQIDGRYGKVPAHKGLHHHHAMNCPGFAHHADFAFVFGNKDEKHNTALISCTQAPFRIPTPSRWCQIHGEFGEITPVESCSP